MASQTVNLRKLFLPSKKGWCFIDADWAQVENRIGAILTGETFLLEAFERGEDIYRKVYAEMFGVSLNSVTKPQRQIGKSLVLGQNYDMSYIGLSKALGCSEGEAKKYEHQYKEAHPMTQRAKQQMLEFCRSNGYIKTHFGRIRYIPDINSPDKNLRFAAEREVWNTYIQGTALDILKISLIRLNKLFTQKNKQAHIILPVHDEILCEASVFDEDIWEIALLVKDAMEVSLKGVKLPVAVEFGWSFGELYSSFEELVARSPKEYTERLLQSSYFHPPETNPNVQAGGGKVDLPQKSVEPVKEDDTPSTAVEPVRLVEADYQLPAFVKTIEKSVEVPLDFLVTVSDYKDPLGYCVYFVILPGNETHKLPYKVKAEFKLALDKLPGKLEVITVK